MDRRTLLCTAAIMSFLQSQPGEFTAQEIRRLGTGFHCDNDEDDVESACIQLVRAGFIEGIDDGNFEAYHAFKAKR